MDKYLKNSEVKNYEHCIIKEELIISDSDDHGEDIKVEIVEESIDEKINNASFLDHNVKAVINSHNKSNGAVKDELKIGIKNGKSADNNFFSETKHSKSNEQSKNAKNKNAKNVKAKEKLKNILEPSQPDIDDLLKSVAKVYCVKCQIKSEVIRKVASCHKCKTKLKYICESCDNSYPSITELSYHLEAKHSESRYVCSNCNKKFTYKGGLQTHRRIYHQLWQCSKCKKSFKLEHKREHRKVCYKNVLHKCDKCPYVGNFKSNLTNHQKEKHSDYREKCKNCNKLFTNGRSLTRHLKVYCNKTKLLECDYCGHKVYRKDQMRNHLAKLHVSGLFKDNYFQLRTCKYCSLSLNRYEQMRFHLERCECAPLSVRRRSQTADQPDLDTALKKLARGRCANCKVSQRLRYRVRRCSKCDLILRFVCKSCPDKTYVDSQLLREHVWIKHVQNDVTFYHCDKCRCSYNRKKNLKMHQKLYHSLEPTADINHKCSRCNKNYRYKGSLRKHQMSCGQQAKFSCDKCSYKTHFKASLIEHLMAKRATCI